MNCIGNQLKLPTVTDFKLMRCAQIFMSNGESYFIKSNDLVAIQFVLHDEKILVRRGRVKDIVIMNRRELSRCEDNVSHITLDCSEQFSVKIIDIYFKDIIKIGAIDEEFEDYKDRITHLEPNFKDGNHIPVREHGMITKEEHIVRVVKPNMDNVVKMDPDTGRFDDIDPKLAIAEKAETPLSIGSYFPIMSD